jgi:hypothetical protein
MAMSQKERDWLEWLKRAKDGVVSQRQSLTTRRSVSRKILIGKQR